MVRIWAVRGLVVVLATVVAESKATESSIPFIRADAVHAQGITGHGVTVAVIDCGVDYGEPGLHGGIAPGGMSWILGQPFFDLGADPYSIGHGTYMSLIITDEMGVAPDAMVLPVRTADLMDVANAVDYVRSRRAADPTIRVINLSLGSIVFYGCTCDNNNYITRALADALFSAANAGIITFAATGNEGQCGGIITPACVSAAVPVAANYDGHYPNAYFDPPADCMDISPDPYWVTCFSNITQDCDWFLAAPGYDITVGGFSGDGTSQATAHCSGVAALMFSKNACGGINAYTARQIIWNTAWSYSWGWPYCPLPPEPKHVNALAAVYAVPDPVCSVPGDLDCDGLVSGYDFPRFERCMDGPAAQYPHTFCVCTDFPSSPPDGDVDLRDLRLFQLSFDGPGTGACCHADGSCNVITVYECLAENGAVYHGHGSTCAQTNCVITRYNNAIDPLVSYKAAGPGLQLADDITLSGSGPGMLTSYWLLVYGGGGGSFDVTAQLYTGCPGAGGTPIAGTQHTFYGNPDGEPVQLIADFDPPVLIPQNVWMVLTFSNPQAGWFIAEQAEIGYTEDRFGRNDPPWQCWYWHGPSGPYCGMWAMIECGKVTGACCLPDQSCIEGTAAECSAVNGVYQGHGTTCAQVNCSPTTGACCRPNGTCTQVTQAQCTTLGGTFYPQTNCGAVDCTPERYSNTIGPPYGYAAPDPGYQLADDMTLAGAGSGNLIHYDVMVCRPSGGSYNVTASLHTGCPPSTGNQIAGTTYSWNNLASGMYHTLNADFPPILISGTVWLRLQFSVVDAGWIVAQQAEIGYTENRFAAAVPSWGCTYWFGGSPWAGFWANLTFGGGPAAPQAPVTWVDSVVPAVPPVRLTTDSADAPEERVRDEPALRFEGTGHWLAARRGASGPGPDDWRGGTVTLLLESSVAGQTIEGGTSVDWAIYAEVSTGDNSGLALLSADLVQDAGNPALFDLPPAATIGPLMAAFDRPGGISNPGPSGSAFGGTPVGAAGSMDLEQIGGSQNTFGMAGYHAGLDVDVDSGIGQSGPVLIASGSFAAPLTHGQYTFRLENVVANVLVSVGTPPAHSPVSAANVNTAAASFSFTVARPICRGDLNCSGFIDFDDINPFTLALSNWEAWKLTYPNCPEQNADVNGDGQYGGVNGFGDINPFIELLASGGGYPIPCP